MVTYREYTEDAYDFEEDVLYYDEYREIYFYVDGRKIDPVAQYGQHEVLDFGEVVIVDDNACPPMWVSNEITRIEQPGEYALKCIMHKSDIRYPDSFIVKVREAYNLREQQSTAHNFVQHKEPGLEMYSFIVYGVMHMFVYDEDDNVLYVVGKFNSAMYTRAGSIVSRRGHLPLRKRNR